MCNITVKANLNGPELTVIPVLNPGDWFGKTWLLEIGGSYTPLYLVVEAQSMADAIDELADNEKFGHLITADEDNLSDYDPDTCHYGPSGQVLDLDWLMVHGMEGVDCPFPCRYIGDDLPSEGINPTDYCNLDV